MRVVLGGNHEVARRFNSRNGEPRKFADHCRVQSRARACALGLQMPVFESAPDITELESTLIGTRAQVLAVLALQDGYREWRSRKGFIADPPAAAPAPAASDADADDDVDPMRIINLDTGCAVSIAEVAELYEAFSPKSSAFTRPVSWQRQHSHLSDVTTSSTSPRTPPASAPASLARISSAGGGGGSTDDIWLATRRSRGNSTAAEAPAGEGSFDKKNKRRSFVDKASEVGSDASKRLSQAAHASMDMMREASGEAVGALGEAAGALGQSVNNLAQHLPDASGVAEALGGGTSTAPPPGALRERARRTGVLGRALEPLMCGPLLKRGKTLGQWKLRWYTLSVDGEFTCYHRKHDLDKGAAPMFTVQIAQLKVSMLPPERQQELNAKTGVFGFRLDGGRGKEGRFRELFAETQDEFQRWIGAFALLGACAGAAVGTALAAGSSQHSPTLGHRPLSPTFQFDGSRMEHNGNYVLDLCGFMLCGTEATAYRDWCAARAKEVKGHAKQYERWTRLLGHEGPQVRSVQPRAASPSSSSMPADAAAPPSPSTPRPQSPRRASTMRLWDKGEGPEPLSRADSLKRSSSDLAPGSAPGHRRTNSFRKGSVSTPDGSDKDLDGSVHSTPRRVTGTELLQWLGTTAADWRGLARSAHELAVGGVPNSLRVRVWSQASGAARLMSTYPTHYLDMVTLGSNMHEHDRNEIEIDLNRTFPNHPLFAGDAILADAEGRKRDESGYNTGSAAAQQASEDGEEEEDGDGDAEGGDASNEKKSKTKKEPRGKTALRRVLLAYIAHNRGLGYCQALNYVGGMLLLLTELREELAFFLMIHLTERCVTGMSSTASKPTNPCPSLTSPPISLSTQISTQST